MMELYDLGEYPPLGVVPPKMHAFAVRQSRFGQPREAWKREVLPTPQIQDDEVLIYVMATGINYNNVWAGSVVRSMLLPSDRKASKRRKIFMLAAPIVPGSCGPSGKM
jgi:crotonyl-CoA carboxylase/reductase